MIDLKEMESAQQSAQRFNEAVAKASHVSFERGYENGYLDGRRDKKKKMSDPNRKEYSYSEKPNSSDVISRRKAFEYFVTLWECIGTIMDRDEWEDVCMTTANEIPSAQPGIIRCHKCIYWDRDTVRRNSNDAGWWNEAICERYSDEIWESWKDADWYCADAERRTDG